MKAIILAAGLGTRLRPMTENTPKALVQVNQKPLVEYQIEFLKERGIDDIIIVVGYLKEQFDSHNFQANCTHSFFTIWIHNFSSLNFKGIR